MRRRDLCGQQVALGFAMGLIGLTGVLAADSAENQVETGWSDSAESSVVVTEGNSKAETFAFKNTLKRVWKRSNLQLKVDGLRSDTADDRFVLIEPGLEWPVLEDPPPAATSTVEPDLEPDAERYFAEGRYERNISQRLFWSAGGSWERNEDAGILARYIAFGGLGHVWKNTEDLEFSTSYGLSFTDREEEEPDPEKEDSFAGVRLSWDYMNRFGKAAVYENDFTSNLNLEDASDYSLDMTNSLSVSLTHRMALKVSLQWLYEKEPALEEVDLIAYVEIFEDPITGELFYRTVASGGGAIEIGDADIRKEELDSIFRTSLVINF